MIKLELTDTYGWEAAIRGMRNPMNSWEKSDSLFHETADFDPDDYPARCLLGPNDLDLARRLAKGGPVHAKYRRQIFVSVDITAPLYWWKEFDTYKVGTTANSCSTMHKIHAKEFVLEDFSTDKLHRRSMIKLLDDIDELNFWRYIYLNGGEVDNYDGTDRIFEPRDKDAWYQMIQLLPSSYNQKRTVTMTYENLYNMYHSRKDHKLDEWRVGFCGWAKSLPYSELFTLRREDTSFQEDLDFFVNDCTDAQLKALYERVKEKLGDME